MNILFLFLAWMLAVMIRYLLTPFIESTGNYRPGLFGNRGDFGGGSQETMLSDPYAKTRQKTVDYLAGEVGKSGKKYEGELTAPMSDEETKSMEFLKKYGASNLSQNQTWGNASKVINDTLTNQYDPTTSPYYQAVKAESQRGLAETNADIASNAAGGGRYWTGARLGEQREAGTDVKNALNTLLGQIFMQERQNQLSVIPQAMTMSQVEQDQPLKQAEAFQTLGALPRTIKQAGDTAKYQDWLNSEYEYPLQILALAQGLSKGPIYGTEKETYGDKFMNSYASSLGNTLGTPQKFAPKTP